MTRKELKRLKRSDLLEMLLGISKENDQLREALRRAKEQLDDRTIAMENSDSLAEAALRLNGIFDAAQAASDQYMLNRKNQADQLLAQAREKLEAAQSRWEEMLTQANEKAEEIMAQANRQAERILAEAEQKRSQQDEQYRWITEILENSEEA